MIPRTPSSPRLGAHSPVGNAHERSVASLEKEIMRLQEVLKEREAEIQTLEITLKAGERGLPSPSDKAEAHTGEMEGNGVESASHIPKHSVAIQQSMELHHVPEEAQEASSDVGEPIDRLNELLL